MTVVTDHQIGAALTNELWRELMFSGGPVRNDPMWFLRPGHFPVELLERLDTPIGRELDPAQKVMLAKDLHDPTEYVYVGTEAEVAYCEDPSTRVYEDLHEHGGWAMLVSSKLSELAKCKGVCRLIFSKMGDKRFSEHIDGWCNLIIQMSGQKRWWVRRTKQDEPETFVTSPGDLLIMREGVLHHALTQGDDNASSLHAQIAVVTRKSL